MGPNYRKILKQISQGKGVSKRSADSSGGLEITLHLSQTLWDYRTLAVPGF